MKMVTESWTVNIIKMDSVFMVFFFFFFYELGKREFL